jgi:hypothetical protein
MFTRVFGILFFIFSGTVVFGQDFILDWQKAYGGERNEIAYDAVECTDGGFIVVGSTNSKNSFDVKDSQGFDGAGGSDFWVIKVSAKGNLEWSKTFGGSKEDIATSIVKTINNEYVILGSTLSTDGDASSNGINGGLLMVRLKLDGSVVSKRMFNGGNSSSSNSYQSTNSFSKPTLKVLPSGQMVVGATRSINASPFSRADFYFAMLTPYGDTMWEKTYGGGLEDYLNDIIPTSDNGFLMVGTTLSLERDIPGAGQGFYDGLAIKIDASGRQSWAKGFGGLSLDVFHSVTEIGSTRTYAIAGESSSTSGVLGSSLGEKDGLIVKIDNQGSLISATRNGGTGNDGFYKVLESSDDKLYFIGTSESTIGTVKPKGTLTDVWVRVVKASTGQVLYDRLQGGADIDLARGGTFSKDGVLFLAGSSRSTDGDLNLNRGQSDFWSLTLDTPPPVVFGRFESFLNEFEEIELLWTTTYERGSQYIYVEKSDDNKTFVRLDEVFAAINSSITKTYKFKDKNPVVGTNYYRLKYSDQAGKTYDGPNSSFRFVPLANEPLPNPEIVAYPNPATDYLILESSVKDFKVQLVDVQGADFEVTVMELDRDTFKITFNQGLKPGVYVLKVSSPIYKQSRKIVIR